MGLLTKSYTERVFMSYDYSLQKNKHPKVNFQQYLYNIDEPTDSVMKDARAAVGYGLLDDMHAMRRRFRRIAHKLRDAY